MAGEQQSRDLAPGPSGEFAHVGVNIWGNIPELPILPDKSEYPLGEGLNPQHHVIRQPDYVANGVLAVPAAANTSAIVPLVMTPQTGIIRANTGLISNLSAAAASNTLITLQNYVGQIYFSMTVQALNAAFAGTLWAVDDIWVKFQLGLYLAVLTGAQGTNTGLISISTVWRQ